MLSGSLKGACGQISERILYVGDETECDDGADGGQNRAEMDIAIDATVVLMCQKTTVFMGINYTYCLQVRIDDHCSYEFHAPFLQVL